MTDLTHALQSGATNLWVFIPTAILLGALHGLEPGHSKTMMAAFIIAIRGTLLQAVLLGLSAAVSHSLIIWVLAALALHFGSQWNADSVEPYLQLFSAVCVLGLAAWMFHRTRADVAAAHHHEHGHDHGHAHGDHDHHHHDECVLVPTGHGTAELSIFEDGAPPVFRVVFHGEKHAAGDVLIETERSDGTKQMFTFAAKGDYLESTSEVPEPHEFDMVFTLRHGGHEHAARLHFREGSAPRVEGDEEEFQDAHERAHALDIARRFAGRTVTTPQIVLFGITGGLMPCPAAFTVLLVCLQLKKVTLGFAMVGAFSLGLAVTMVSVGALAALSMQHAQKKFRGFGDLMRRAPYISCALLVVLALYMAWTGWHGLGHAH